MIPHNYTDIDGWFNMEAQYLTLINSIPKSGVFVELGAWKGKSTSFVVTEIINRGLDIKFYTVDTFNGVLNGTDQSENNAYKQYDLTSIYDTFKENTKHIKKHFKTIVNDSARAAALFDDNSVDAIFIDAGHSYESVKLDLNSWFPKMKPGSLMSGHDYAQYYPGVVSAVDEFFKGHLDHIENNCWFKKIIK
jgi:hypothetical protein